MGRRVAFLAVLTVATVATLDASACPDRRCAAREGATGGGSGPAAAIDAGLSRLPSEAAIAERRPLADLVVPRSQDASDEPRTPWIWRHLRQVAEDRLPRHQRDEFVAVWSPVVVSGPDETVPGVGVAGHF